MSAFRLTLSLLYIYLFFIQSTIATLAPSGVPSGLPTNKPSSLPTSPPTEMPSSIPSGEPSQIPSSVPSGAPSYQPTSSPSGVPSGDPTSSPVTSIPSSWPSSLPSSGPSNVPTSPSSMPSSLPSGAPTSSPSTLCSTCSPGEYYLDCDHVCVSCDPGYYCDGGCSPPTPCSVGTYASGYGSTSVSDCLSCPDGYTNAVTGSSNCTVCPAGYSCPDNAGAPEICDKGYFSPGFSSSCFQCPSGSYANARGSSECTICPAGHACLDPTVGPVACPIGSYAPVNSTECIGCEAGYFCSSTGGSLELCPNGSYSLSNWAYCVVCPAGHGCVNVDQVPEECEVGTYSLGGQSFCSECEVGTFATTRGSVTCDICPAGHSCLDVTSDPVPCTNGTYAAYGDGVCSACPDGQYSAGEASVCKQCPAGHSCPSASDGPELCPEGFYAGYGDGVCSPCDPGTHSLSDRTQCIACDAGYQCGDPTVGQVLCSPGFYSLNGTNVACTPCPRGSYCPSVYDTPLACPSGTYSGYKQTNCTECPSGFECLSVDSSPQECSLGWYSQGGSSGCAPCPAGSYCPSSDGLPLPCGPGNYSTGGSASCTPCEAGHYCPNGMSSYECPAGLYSHAGESSCEVCPDGYFCPHPALVIRCPEGTYSGYGATNCTICPQGYGCIIPWNDPVPCLSGTFSIGGQANCTSCPPGHYCPSTSDGTVVECADGSYSVGGQSECDVCPAGYYCPFKDSNIEVPCPDGSYSTGASMNCTNCPAGYTCNPSGSVITECSDGEYSVEGDMDCHSCPVGRACPYKGLAVQLLCEEGTYSIGNQTVCTDCPPGYACPSTSSSTMTACASGTFSAGSQTSCTVCPAGYSCPSTTSAAISPCTVGYYSPAGVATCNECPAGSYCVSPAASPVTCEPGSYSIGGMNNCTVCPPGYYCDAPYTEPSVCPVGYYSTGGAFQCSLCSPGYMCTQGFNTNPTPLGAECPAGGYCNPADTYTPCPTGTYGVVEAGQSLSHACATCDAGYYCNSTGLVRETRSICPAGAYCPDGTSAPVLCSAGTASPRVGQTSVSTCERCLLGSYCLNEGTESGSTCPQGYYCPTGTADYLDFPCPAGTFGSSSGLSNAGQCSNCTIGHYCPSGSSFPQSCPAGTYQPNEGSPSLAQCLPCEAGYACPATGMHTMTTPCARGHYCPVSTQYATQYPCPAGTYTDSTSLVNQNGCTQCPNGYSCGSGTTSSSFTDCPAGYICPEGSAAGSEAMCPGGTYSNRTNLWRAEDCTPCPAGFYCTGGDTAISGSCQAGYYCPAETSSATSYPCPAGTYSSATDLYDAAQCTDCPAGSYCIGGLSSPTSCPPGTYGPTENLVSGTPSDANSCSTCPAGYMCPTGSSTAIECGVGSYSTEGSSSCSPCIAGHYCGSNTTSNSSMHSGGGDWSNAGDEAGVCFNGTYCAEGMTRSPDLENDACPAGYYCPAGTSVPRSCPAGTYSSSTGQDEEADCNPTPAGYYTIAGSSTYTGMCEPGYYCPEMSTGPTQVPCPARYYRPEYGAASLDDCSLCVAGGYCPEGSAEPLVCPQGYYCVTGLSDPEPCEPGTYGNSTGLRRSEDCHVCDAGYYCDGFGLISPRGLCDPGFYCLSGSNTSSPFGSGSMYTDSSTIGGICPTGSYCPIGSGLPTHCPTGTFNNNTGGSSVADCADCTPGMYCEGVGNSFPTGKCFAGYYCDGRSSTPIEFESLPGSYSELGSSAPTLCEPGTYNDKYLQSSCTDCPAGYYCPYSNMSSYEDFICPAGRYCPIRTSNPYRCPPGTYSSQQGNTASSDCLSCTPGSYCDQSAMTDVAGPCEEGYYCTGGATISVQITSTSTGGPCTPGFYCLEGSPSPIPCPRGTFMSASMANGNVTYLGRSYYCDLCTGGHSCNETGMSAVGAECEAGYYCKLGAASPTPYCGESFCEDMYGLCPEGHYCPAGTIDPNVCLDGSFMNHTGAETCYECPPGYYCDSSFSVTSYRACPQGYYCPEGTGLDWVPCPRGKYGDRSNLQSEDECTPCDPGMYCNTEGLTEPSGNCSAGFYCPEGSLNAWGQTLYTGNHSCPVGSYCPEGSELPFACPPGKYNPNQGIGSIEHCLDCTPGHYCDRYNMSSPSGVCDEGYYCIRGSDIANPVSTYVDGISGNIVGGGMCPRGSYCPSMTTLPKPCVAGTYNNLVGQSSCFECPQGYFCPGNVTDYWDDEFHCPMGYYCPNGTEYDTQFPCPPGTFNNQTLRSSLDDCFSTPPGYYAEGSGNDWPTGQCATGYYCPSEATTATPFCATSFCMSGGQCTAGEECPEGTGYASPCRGGHYCANSSGLVTGPCSSGYYCIEGSVSSTPLNIRDDYGNVVADICPRGSFCEEASIMPTACGPGYFSSSTGNSNFSFCFECTPGFYCPNASTAYPVVCPEGYYCPLGTSYYELLCDEGYMCPEGSYAPQACEAGTYQSKIGQSNCSVCPAGYYCERGSGLPVACPAGHYCLEGTQYDRQFPCSNGTFNNRTREQSPQACHDCSPGMYCSDRGLAIPSGPCSAGYFCGSASTVPTPHDSDGFHVSYSGETCVEVDANSTNDICPPGHYCPEGSPSPVQCPPGTNTSSLGLTSVGECQACVKGYYCPLNGTVLATRQCLAGYYCPSGTSNPTDFDDLVCPTGHYCPVGSDYPIPCVAGTYQDERGNDTCKSCPAGYYCEVNTTTPVECPPGYYCPSMTEYATEFPCPNGTFSNSSLLQSAVGCLTCPPGMYCDGIGLYLPTGPCSSGYYCGGSASVPTPHDSDGFHVSYSGETCVEVDANSTNDICPPGHYCPEGSPSPVQCPPGTNTSSLGLTSVGECQACVKGYYCPLNGTVLATRQCLAGYYCPSGTSNPTDFDDLVCPTGHYCPVGSDYPIPCVAGTYQDERGNDTCKSCPAGYYCEVNTTTPVECPPGYYCPSMTEYATEFPCPDGTFSNSSLLQSAVGCLTCPPGMYCDGIGLYLPTGPCSSGYYCGGSASVPTPHDSDGFHVSYSGETCVEVDANSTNDICPPGHYCPEGSPSPVQCPPGTNTSSLGLTSVGECQACVKGYYCPLNGTVLATRQCLAGYYCPSGTSNPTDFDDLVCPTGHYCPVGSDYPIPCVAGTYQDERGNDTCKSCPAGYYCEVNTTTPVECPPGYYCPSMTEYATEFPCPNGTYSNASSLGSVWDCQECTPGMYCGAVALLEPSAPCSSGYYCGGGSAVSSPHDSDGFHVSYSGETCVEVDANSTNDICPPGHYCPEGSPSPVQCPPGTNTSSLGLTSVGECQACVKGYYCPLNGTVLATRQCLAGYYCPSGTSNPTDFDDLVCPTGHYCPVGSDYPIPCVAGTYQDERGNDTCKSCPAGYYCEVNTTTPVECPPGYYCPSMTEYATEFPCPNGTYSNASSLGSVWDCQECTPGMYCGAVALLEPSAPCSSGYYCGGGSAVSSPHDSDGFHVSYSGETCVEVDANSTNDICPPGHYCPEGSPSPVQCPPGTNTSSLGLTSVGECQACVKGYYCPLNGTVLATRQCLAGYYCPSGTSNPTDFDDLVCPTGHYCPVGSDYPIPCVAGTYQDERGNDTCKSCPAGYYCEVNTTTPVECPPGYYCPSMTEYATEFPCPNGTYSNASSLGSVWDCQECTPGMYCGAVALLEPSAPCSSGYYCGGGSAVSSPHDSDGFHVSYSGETCVEVDANSTNDICPPGHYCPEGSPSPVQCPPGTNTSSLGLTSVGECQACVKGYYCPLNGTVLATRQCLAGYYCPSGTSNPTDFDDLVCPTGHYCPVGSDYPIPCVAGTYQDERGNDTCKSCPAGYYCEVNTTTPVECPPGYYCPSMTEYATEFPCPNGTYSNASSLGSVWDCQECTPGMYCGAVALLEPSAPCSSGYYCGGGSAVSSPHDSDGFHVSYSGETCVEVDANSTNDICPPGHYCPEGSPSPVQCPPGTNTSSLGLTSVGECQACVKGYYCPLNGTVLATRQCLAGYYCPSGTSNPTDFDDLVCPTGHYCPVGSDYPIPCVAGTYQDERGNDTCKSCPAGYYCEVNTTTPVECPPGYYCPSMTEYATEFPCPNGTYSNASSLGSVWDCQECTPGMYCGAVALLEPSAPCSSGYYCGGGSAVSSPHDSDGFHVSYSGETCVEVDANSTNDICPPGHYCPEGSPSPVQCPPGTNTSSLGLTSVGECQACVKGYYCPLNGTVLATRQCLAGYYCPSGTSNPTDFDDLVCPTGHYCPVGSDYPIPCVAGTYQDERGNDTCKSCPAGYYCEVNTTTPVECPPGYYCPSMTEYATEFPCSPGSLQNMSGQYSCDVCPTGSYCPHFAMRAALPCEPGYYCPPGLANFTDFPCPVGTFSDLYGLKYPSECSNCTPGWFCASTGLVEPEGLCSPGHYCSYGANTPVPTDGVSGGLCGGGHACTGGASTPYPINGIGGYSCPSSTQCPRGSAEPEGCPAGTYNPTTGVETCPLCPAGTLCPGNSTFPADCPLRNYCPEGSGVPTLCPNGTYGAAVNLTSADECASCPAGYYCVDGTITGECSAGYFCRSGQGTPTPLHDTAAYDEDPASILEFLTAQDGGQCPPGHYCYSGTSDPFPCENTTVRLEMFGASPDDCGPCPAGYVCYDGDPVPEPCEPGYYCPLGESRIACPEGRYNPSQSQSGFDDCLICPAGAFCNATGISNPNEWPCPVGHFCLNGSTTPLPCPSGSYRDQVGAGSLEECYECPGGHYCPRETNVYFSCPNGVYCPAGSVNTTVCPPGYFCPAKSTYPRTCPENYYCPQQTTDPVPCFRGTYCPNGTAYPYMCALGYKAVDESNFTFEVLSSEETACEACPPGEYGTDESRLTCSTCPPGYVCEGATTSATPNSDEENGYICPKGAYCPAGSHVESLCPVGTYQPNFGESNETACTKCAAGFYQNEEGQDSCYKCSSSSTSVVGSTLCTCKGQNRIFQPTDGWCVCRPGYEFVDSNLVVSSEEDGEYDCQPIVYSRCRDGQRRSSTGECVNSEDYCNEQCGSVGGTFIESTGTCECNGLPTLDEICDNDCRENVIKATCDSDGNVVITDPVSGETDTLDLSGIVSEGSIDCSIPDSNIYSMSTSGGSFSGSFGLGETLSTELSRRRRRLGATNDIYATLNTDLRFRVEQENVSQFETLYLVEKPDYRRHLQSSNSSNSSVTIPNPLVCLKLGDSIVFDISNTDYPEYVKDSLLNTNENFDYGSFRDLVSAASSSLVISSFSVTFSIAGTYVFRMSSTPSNLIIVTVMPSNVNCSTESYFVEFTESNLITVGVTSNDNIVLSPDWDLVLGLLLGMLGLVLVLISFMYYFRKKAWSSHFDIDSKARSRNKKGEVKSSKGGFHSKKTPRLNQVAPSAVSVPGNEDDLEAAAAAKEAFDLEFDDDMLVPELAKHMQSHHDEMDRQMHIHQDLLTDLQNSLKREVDDLKNLLTMTAIDMGSGSNSGLSARKLHALLSRLKVDLSNRAMYETGVNTTQARILQAFGRLQKLLDEGPESVARAIVDEVGDEVAIAYNHQNTQSQLESTILHGMIQELESIKEYVESSLSQSIGDEDRRHKNAQSTFEQTLKASNIELPQAILDGIDKCMTADVETDNATDDLVSAFKAFSQRIPKLVSVMVSAESSLGRELMNSMDLGNQSILDKAKHSRMDTLASYLSDLYEALHLLLPKSEQRKHRLELAHVEADCFRKELVAEIDRLLVPISLSPREVEIETSTRKQSSQSKSDIPLLRFATLNEEDSGSEHESRTSALHEKLERSLEYHDKLTEAQKVELIENVENDNKRLDSVLQMEEERCQDALSHLVMKNDDSDDDDGISSRHALEKETLAKRLEAERNTRLNALMRQESKIRLSDDAESVKESMVATLASTRYAVQMRLCGVIARIKFLTVHGEYSERRLEKRRQYQKDNIRNSDDFVHSYASTELHDALLLIDADEKLALDNLNEELNADREASEAAEVSIRETWNMNPGLVNIDEEMTSLKQITVSEFRKVREMLALLTSRSRKLVANEGDFRMDEIVHRVSRFEDNDMRDQIMDRVRVLCKTLLEENDVRLCEEQKIIDTVESDINMMLEMATSWGPMIDTKNQQSHLQDRILIALHSYHDGQLRLATTENQLRAEAAEMKLFSKLNKLGTDEATVSKAIADMREMQKMDTSFSINSLVSNQQRELAEEKEYQKIAPVDYELELAKATVRCARRDIEIKISTEQSQRNVLQDVISSLLAKKEYILTLYRSKNLPEYVVGDADVQIDAEIQREECELNAAYTSIGSSLQLTERHAAMMVMGHASDAKLPAVDLELSHCQQVFLLQQSFGAEMVRVIHSKLVVAHTYREFEEKRGVTLGKPPEELETLFHEIEKSTCAEIEDVKRKIISDSKVMEDELLQYLRDKERIQNDYCKALLSIKQRHDDARDELDMKFANERRALIEDIRSRSSLRVEDALASALLSFDQNSAAVIAEKSVAYHDEMCEAFKRFLAQQTALDKVEDEIRTQRNNKQQEIEAMTMVMEISRTNKLEELLEFQVKRRRDVDAKRSEYERDLIGLEEQLKQKKMEAKNFLQSKLALRRKAREKELEQNGLSVSQAKHTAQAESERYETAEEKKLEQMLADEENTLRSRLHTVMDMSSECVERRRDQLKACLAGGIPVFMEKEYAKLEDELTQRRSECEQRYLDQGMSETEAKNAATDELEDSEKRQRKCLRDSLATLEKDLIDRVELQARDDIQRSSKTYNDKKSKIREKLLQKKNDLKRVKSNEMAKRRSGRERELQESGTSEGEAKRIADAELSSQEIAEMQEIDDMFSGEEKSLLERIDEEASADECNILRTRDDTIAALRDGLTSVNQRKRDILDERLRDKRMKVQNELLKEGMTAEAAVAVAEEECKLGQCDIDTMNEEIRLVQDYLRNSIDNVADDNLLKYRLDYEKALNGLEMSFQVKKSAVKSMTKERLQRRREQRKRELLARGKNIMEAEEQVSSEFNNEDEVLLGVESAITSEFEKAMATQKRIIAESEVAQTTTELALKENKESIDLRNSIGKEERDYLCRAEDAALSVAAATREAAKIIIDQTEDRIAHIRSQYEGEIMRLQQEMLEKRKANLESLSAEQTNNREKARNVLQEEGYSPRAIEMEMDGSLETQRLDLIEKCKKEESDLISQKKKEMEESILRILDDEHKKAAHVAVAAVADSTAAQAKLNALRLDHEAAEKQLRNQLAHDYALQSDNLKARLESRLSKKLKQIDEEGGTDEDREHVLSWGAAEEAKLISELREQHERDLEESLNELKKRQEREMKTAFDDAKQKELAAAAAAAREAVLEAERSQKARDEEETNQRELQRLRTSLEREEKKRKDAQENEKLRGKGRLQNRLADKRARKERELREQEERALEELAKKQAAEKEEKERLRQAKMLWTERLKEAEAAAESMDLVGRAKEDYCFRETLGKKLVPENHLSEAAQAILGSRHSAEMAELLKIHYAQRQSALKSAMEKVMQDKAEARFGLLEKLVARKSTEEFISHSMRDLDAKFSKTQAEAEESAILMLERDHMKQQMALRQRQLEEVSSAINLYSDTESLAKLRELSNKSQAEEMAEYRARLESEKKAREEKIVKEREEREAQLRAEHEEHLKKLKDELQRQKSMEEAEIERSKQEFAKKQAAASETLHTKERSRIVTMFKEAEAAKQEALDRERVTQKNKTLARREQRRRTINKSKDYDSPRGVERRTGLPLPTSESTVLDVGLKSDLNTTTTADSASVISPALVQSINLIEEKLNRIDRVMAVLEAHGIPTRSQGKHEETTLSSRWNSDVYVDINNPPQGDELVPVDKEKLSVQEAARLDFGRHLVELLGLSHIDIKAARALPPSTVSNNAFKNSYLFDERSQVLYIHSSRLSSSGDFGLVAIHALSHIKVNPSDISNDLDPQFMAEFYTNLRILSQDLYKRSKHSVDANISGAPSTPSNRRSSLTSSMSHKFSSSNLLSSNKDKPKHSEYFAHRSIQERLKQYAQEGGFPAEFVDRYNHDIKSNSDATRK